jgi:hypothetical protein
MALRRGRRCHMCTSTSYQGSSATSPTTTRCTTRYARSHQHINASTLCTVRAHCGVCVWVQLDEHAVAMREKLDLDKERTVRTRGEMHAEAATLRALFD